MPLLTATLIFATTALMGVWVAPDRYAALLRFSTFVLGLLLAMSIAYVARYKAEIIFGVLGVICALLAAVSTVHFLLTVNWAEVGPHRLRLMQQIGLWIHYHSPELSNLPNLHKNMTGGMLIILLPLGLSGTIWAWTRRSWLVTVVAVVAILVSLFGLVMTNSRGAWLGFGLAIGFTIYFIWRIGPGSWFSARWSVDFLILAVAVAFITGFFLSLKLPEFEVIPSIVLGDSTGRTALWRDSLPLIQDYPFTGSGLGSTTMVYSSYVFLLHVPYLSHSHNLFMQIAIEQGIPGLFAFVAMVIFAILGLINVYQHGNYLIRVYSAATFAALMAMLWHGIVEAELYAHLLWPIVFLPFGLTLALLLGNSSKQPMSWSDAAIKRANQFALFGTLAPIVAIIALFFWPGALAALQANMGTVTQTRAELAVYHWPEWPIQDELRRNDVVDLSVAMEHYTNALVLNPMNVTAHRRLGQIAISVGDYELAQSHLERAYNIAPDQRATRQMLGEIYAISGEPDRAVRLWQTVDTNNGQLDARYWWHTHIGEEQQAALLKEAISQLRNID